MKRVYFILSIMILTFSCQDIENPALGSDSQWIQFEKSTDNVSEATPEPKQVAVLYASDANPNGIDVNFSYTASTPDGYAVEPANGVVTIPAGEFVGYITITPVNDLIAGDNIVLNFTIENNSMPVGIAGQGIYNVTSEVTIIEDDCPIASNDWEGDYSVTEVFTSGVNEGLTLAGAFGESYLVHLSLDTTDPTGTKFNLSNALGFNVYFDAGTTLTFLTCTKQVQFNPTTPRLAEFAEFTNEISNYVDDTFTIKCNGSLGNYGPYEFVLTKQ